MREHSRLLVDIRARDNAGKLPRHYIDDDKFEPEEIDYMRRIIGNLFLDFFTWHFLISMIFILTHNSHRD